MSDHTRWQLTKKEEHAPFDFHNYIKHIHNHTWRSDVINFPVPLARAAGTEGSSSSHGTGQA